MSWVREDGERQSGMSKQSSVQGGEASEDGKEAGGGLRVPARVQSS